MPSTSLNMNGALRGAHGSQNGSLGQQIGDAGPKTEVVKQRKVSSGGGGGQFRPLSGLYQEQLEEQLHRPPPRRTYAYPSSSTSSRDTKGHQQQQQQGDNVEWNTSFRSCPVETKCTHTASCLVVVWAVMASTHCVTGLFLLSL